MQRVRLDVGNIICRRNILSGVLCASRCMQCMACNCLDVLLHKHESNHTTLPAIRVTDGVESTVLTRWELSDDDRKLISEGGDVYLWVWTFGNPFQPVMLEVATPAMIMQRSVDATQLEDSAERTAGA